MLGMTIVLTRQQEAAIRALVEAGVFESEAAALDFGLRRLTEEAGKLDALRADIQAGIAQADRGELREVNAEEIMARVRRRFETESSGTPSA